MVQKLFKNLLMLLCSVAKKMLLVQLYMMQLIFLIKKAGGDQEKALESFS